MSSLIKPIILTMTEELRCLIVRNTESAFKFDKNMEKETILNS